MNRVPSRGAAFGSLGAIRRRSCRCDWIITRWDQRECPASTLDGSVAPSCQPRSPAGAQCDPLSNGDRMSVDVPPTMRGCLQVLLALALAGGVPLAAAATATTTASVNVRAGPGKSFPTATWFLTGTQVTIEGCLFDWKWCDVSSGRHRGWVYARYLSHRINDTVVTIDRGGTTLGLPQTEFDLVPYWDAHFQNQIWYSRKAYWQRRWERRVAAPERS
jgi:uncharacterized protein YraI